jgi:hypothetical protein
MDRFPLIYYQVACQLLSVFKTALNQWVVSVVAGYLAVFSGLVP